MGLICHDCGSYSSLSEKLIVSRQEVMTTLSTIHQRWEQLQRHKSQLVTTQVAPLHVPIKKSKRPFTLNGDKNDIIKDSQQESKLALA